LWEGTVPAPDHIQITPDSSAKPSEDAEDKWIQRGNEPTPDTWEVIFLWLIKDSMEAQI